LVAPPTSSKFVVVSSVPAMMLLLLRLVYRARPKAGSGIPVVRLKKTVETASTLATVFARGKARFSAEELREMAGIGEAEKKS